MDKPTEPRISDTTTDKTRENVLSFLKAHSTGVLATSDHKGNPHAAVVYFSINDAFRIGFVTKRDTQKHQNIQHNNKVMLVAFESSTQTTVQISGAAEDISDTIEAQEIFDNLLKIVKNTSESGSLPISKLYAGHYVAYQLMPTQIRMATFSQTQSGGNEVFEAIEFLPN